MLYVDVVDVVDLRRIPKTQKNFFGSVLCYYKLWISICLDITKLVMDI